MISEMSDEIHKYIRKCIGSASFDKSKSARITQILDNNEYVVAMSDGTVKTVPSLSSDSFNINDVVCVTVAQNDSKNCYIVGKPNIPKGSSGGGSVDSVNGQTGVVVLDADDISDTSTTNKFVTSADKINLSNLSGTNTGDQDLSGKVDKYNSSTTYPVLASVVHNGYLWVNTSGTSATNVEPGTNYNVWNVTYCNPHIEDNGDFHNAVNQRNASNIPNGSYGIDRWMNAVGEPIVIGSSYLTLPSGSVLTQKLEASVVSSLIGNTITISCLDTSGIIHAGKIIYPDGSASAIAVDDTYFQIYIPIMNNLVQFYAKQEISISSVKLELGSVSTLANDPPANYGEELRKCQRYYEQMPDFRFYMGARNPWNIATQTNIIPFKVTKRTVPVVSFEYEKSNNPGVWVNATASHPDVYGFVDYNSVFDCDYVSFRNVRVIADM